MGDKASKVVHSAFLSIRSGPHGPVKRRKCAAVNECLLNSLYVKPHTSSITHFLCSVFLHLSRLPECSWLQESTLTSLSTRNDILRCVSDPSYCNMKQYFTLSHTSAPLLVETVTTPFWRHKTFFFQCWQVKMVTDRTFLVSNDHSNLVFSPPFLQAIIMLMGLKGDQVHLLSKWTMVNIHTLTHTQYDSVVSSY